MINYSQDFFHYFKSPPYVYFLKNHFSWWVSMPEWEDGEQLIVPYSDLDFKAQEGKLSSISETWWLFFHFRKCWLYSTGYFTNFLQVVKAGALSLSFPGLLPLPGWPQAQTAGRSRPAWQRIDREYSELGLEESFCRGAGLQKEGPRGQAMMFKQLWNILDYTDSIRV